MNPEIVFGFIELIILIFVKTLCLDLRSALRNLKQTEKSL